MGHQGMLHQPALKPTLQAVTQAQAGKDAAMIRIIDSGKKSR